MCLKPSCDHYLGKKECERCKHESYGCLQCGNVPASSVYINSRPIWRPYTNSRCLGCSQEKMTDIQEICRECNNEYDFKLRIVALCGTCVSSYAPLCKNCKEPTDVYAEGSLECPTCFYGDDFLIDVNSKNATRICSGCGEASHLNTSGLCRNCYVEQSMSNAVTDDWGTTKVCPECRKITKRGRKMCTSCALKKQGITTCMGCTTKFKSISRYDSFCLACKKAMSEGVCTSCSTEILEDGMDEHGWCNACQIDHKP